MSNIHGFDFLRSEHTLPSDATAFDGPAAAAAGSESAIPSSPTKYLSADPSNWANRPDLLKQYDVLKFLNAHRSSGCLPPHVILKSTGVHLNPASPNYEPAVAQHLSDNFKVRIEEVPDPENPTLLLPAYGYQAKFANVVDRTTLLAQINRCPNGVAVGDLTDSYDGVKADITALITAGDVLAVANPEDKDRILFPRGEQFLVELDGVVGTGTYEQCREDLSRAVEESNRIREQAKEAAANAAKNGSTNKAATAEGTNGNAEANADTAAAADTTASAADTTASAADATASTAAAADTTASTAAATSSSTASSTTDTAQSEELLAQKLTSAISEETEARRRLDRMSHLISTDIDPRVQMRRGEAINVGGSWFRVSSAIQDGVPLDTQPPRARAPPSVVMMKDLSRKNDADGYIRPFGEYSSKATRGFCIPLDNPLPDEARDNVRRAEAARDRLHKVAGSAKGAGGGSRVGVTGGASSQLLSSYTSAANPESSASAFLSSFKASVGGGGGGGSGGLAGGRKRPGVGRTGAAGRAGAAGGNTSKAARFGNTASTGGGDQSDPQKTLAELVQEAKDAATDPSLLYTHARRHGCTKDVREMFLATRDDVPQSEVELHNLMIHHKLIEPGEPMRRPRMKRKNPDLDNDGKPKKRRYYERKNQRMTNTHLIGTEIGAALARASERQQQGKSVGDGGM